MSFRVGHFFGFCVYIFDIAMLFQFQMIGWGVLSRVLGVAFDCIGSTTIQVCCMNGDKVFACFVIYVSGVILYLDFVCISIDIFLMVHSCVEIFTRGMFRGGDMCLGSLFWVKQSFSFMVFSYIVFFFWYSTQVLYLCCVV